MEIFAVWLGTTIASFGMEFVQKLTIFKDIADLGYKMNIQEIKKYQNEEDQRKEQYFAFFIPFVNILQVFQKSIQYNNNKTLIFNRLRIMDAIEKMSKLEEEEYLKNPTGLTALLLPIKVEKRLRRATSIKINDYGKESEFICEFGPVKDDITILTVKGVASSLTIEEQKKKIFEALNIVQENSQNFDTVEDLIEAANSKTGVDIHYQENEKKKNASTLNPHQDLSLIEQQQVLMQLKEVFKEQQGINENEKMEQEKTLIKVKK